MYGTPYNIYNPQMTIDRIDKQIAELEKMKTQLPAMQTPAALNQTFQLASNGQETMKYADSIDDLKKEIVICDTPFFSKDLSVLWIKNSKGEIKTYTLAEIIQKDEKDIIIDSLQMQIDELKKGANNARESTNNNDNESTTSKKSTNVSTSKSSKTK